MAAPFNLILRKTENAGVALLTAAQVTAPLSNPPAPFTNIVPGKASMDKQSPLVVIYAERGSQEPELSGNTMVTLHVMVKYALADLTTAQIISASDAFTGAVFDVFRPGLPDDLAAMADALNGTGFTIRGAGFYNFPPIADFTCLGGRVTGEEANAEEDMWVETLSLSLMCAPASGM